MYLMGLSQHLSWRKGWDSNPRTGSSPITRFRVERVTASSLPFHKRVLYTKYRLRARLFSGTRTTERCIQRSRAGIFRIPLRYAAEKNVQPSSMLLPCRQACDLPAKRSLSGRKKVRLYKADL